MGQENYSARRVRFGPLAKASPRGRAALAAAIESLESRLFLTTVVTAGATSISSTGGTINATVNPQGSTTQAFFQFSTDPTFVDAPAGTLPPAFGFPEGVAADGFGDVFVADGNQAQTVTKILPDGTTIPIATGLTNPSSVAVDSAGNLFVLDGSNGIIVKVPPTGSPQTLASNLGNGLEGIAVDAAGNVFIANGLGNTVDKILPSGAAQPIASNFNFPAGLAVDAAGNIFVSDSGNGAVKEILASDGSIVTITSTVTQPRGIAVDSIGDIYVADGSDSTVKEILPSGITRTLTTGVNNVIGLAVDTLGEVFVADAFATHISRLSPQTTAANNNLTGSSALPMSAALGSLPSGKAIYYRAVAISGAGEVVGAANSFVTAPVPTVTTDPATSITSSGATANATVNANGLSTGTLFEVATDPSLTPVDFTAVGPGFANPQSVALDAADNVFLTQDSSGIITEFLTNGTHSSHAIAGVNSPTGIAVDPDGNVFITDDNSGLVQELTPSLSSAKTITSAISAPFGIAVDSADDLFVTDIDKNTVDEILPNGLIRTIATGFNFPSGIAVDASGDLFVADFSNNAVKKILPDGTITTVGAGFVDPQAVAVDAAGDVFVTESGGSAVKEIRTNDNIVTLTAGLAANGAGGGVAVDVAGNVFFADAADSEMAELSPPSFAASPQVNGSMDISVEAFLTGLTPGTYTFRAISMSANGIGVGNSDTFVIAAGGTQTSTIALSTSATSTFYGIPLTLTATVSPTGPSGASGVVAFFDGATQLGPAAPFFGLNGTVTLHLPALSAGDHTITAHYNGDSNFAPSTSSPATVTVKALPPISVTAPDISVDVAAETVTVVYSSLNAVDTTTVGTQNIAVTGPSNETLTVTGATFVTSDDGLAVTATYIAAAPGTGGSWPAGTYTIAAGSVPVTDESGNVLVIGTKMFTSALPAQDLSAALAGTIPANVVAGAVLKTKETLTLTPGAGAAAGLSAGAKIVLSPDESSADGIVTLGTTRRRLSFKKGKPVRAKINFNKAISAAAPAGTYHVLIRLTDTNGNIETYETGQTVTIVAPTVDLSGSFVTVPTSVTGGKTFAVTILVTNTSAANAAAVGTLPITVGAGTLGNVFASRNQKIKLKPGKSVKITLKGTLSSASQLIVALDPNGAAFPNDINTANNSFNTTNPITLGG